jgi:diguanylate cyclase (GGDEF)-like protein
MGHLFLFKALDNALLYYLAYPHTELFVTYGNNVLAGSIGDIGKDRVSHGYSGSLVSKGVRYEQRVVPWDRRAEETDEETPLLILQQQIIPPFSVWESVLLGTAGLSFMLILLWAALGSWITDTVKRIMHLDSSADQFAREHAFSPATRQMLASVGEGHEDELADLSHSMKEMMETVLLREEEHRLDGDLLKRFNSLLKAQQETSIDGILVIDEKRKVLNYNSRFAEMWGIPEELVQTFDDRKLLDYILPFLKDAEEFISKVKYLYGNPYETSKDEILLNDGRIFDRYTGPVLLPEGIPYARIWYFRDVTESHRLKQELRDLSLNDELTGLYNRRGFLTFAQQQIKIADRTKKEMMLFFVDMDDLKLINDNLGHHTGDMAIKETAQVLRETFRDSDVIARFGGDEFAVLVSDASVDSENILKERLSKNIESHNEQANRSYKLSISVGTAVHDPAQPYSLDDLIGKADAFMYEQKMGKKRV